MERDVLYRLVLIRVVIDALERVEQLHLWIQKNRHAWHETKCKFNFAFCFVQHSSDGENGLFGQGEADSAVAGISSSQSKRISANRVFKRTTTVPLPRALRFYRRGILSVSRRHYLRLFRGL